MDVLTICKVKLVKNSLLFIVKTEVATADTI